MNYSFPNIDLDTQESFTINSIIKSGWVSNGRHVEEMEHFLEERFGVKHAILCNNATSALTIALKSAGWKNKKIGVPSFTWPSTVYSIESSCRNNEISFYDIDLKTWLITPDENCDALVVVDTFGNNAFKKYDKPVIYDAAHGFDLKNVGNRGLAEVISFSFTKIVTAMEGGVILTNNDTLAEVATELRRLSSRMGEINAVVLKNSIERYDKFYKDLRLKLIDNYRKGFDFTFTEQDIPIDTNYSVYSILFENSLIRNIVSSSLYQNGIEHKIYYEPLILGLPNTDSIFSRILALPIHEHMINDQENIINIINKTVNIGSVPGKSYFYNSGYLKKYMNGK